MGPACDERWYPLYHQYENPDDSTITLQQLVPESKKEEVLKEMHQRVLSGHLGEDKTLTRIKECFYWPGYHNDVRDWCRRCPDCPATKLANPKNRTPLQSVRVAWKSNADGCCRYYGPISGIRKQKYTHSGGRRLLYALH